MQARRKTRLYIVLAVLAGLGLTVSLTLYALSSNIDLFYTPGEIIYGKTETRALPHTGQRLRVGGYVQPGSLQRDPQTLDVRFKLYDARGVVDVSYKGILPDLFREGWPRACWTASGILPPSRCWPNMMKITRRRR